MEVLYTVLGILGYNFFTKSINFILRQEMTSSRKQSVSVVSRLSGTMKTAAASLIFKNRDPEFEHSLQFINSFQKKVQSFGFLSDEIAKDKFCKLKFL